MRTLSGKLLAVNLANAAAIVTELLRGGRLHRAASRQSLYLYVAVAPDLGWSLNI